jgi:hypothetical protein
MESNKAVIDRANVVHDTNPLPGGKIKYQHTNRPRIEKIDVDGVAGAFVLTNVRPEPHLTAQQARKAYHQFRS